MNNYNFTEEEINKILLSSPMVLPNSPAEYGLKGNNIKAYFYDFIRKLMLLLNEHFILIKKDTDESVLSHDKDGSSHSDVRQILKNLADKDVELGNAISNHYAEINLSHDEIKEKISEDISGHNADKYAHAPLRNDISVARQIAENALNSAQGKTRVYPVKDVYEMTELLSESLNVGDRFVLSDKNVPDFTLFEKNSTEENAISLTREDIASGSVELIPGESYLYNGYLLVATESGIDTSLLVKATDFELLELIVSELDRELEASILDIERRLETKEDAHRVVTESAEAVVLQNKTEHNLGLRTKATLILPEEIPDDFKCIVNFRTGECGMEFTFDGVIMTQDDCYGGVLTPCKNKIYEINVKNVDGALIGRVGRSEHTVI